jgi:anti-anti-sigma factor
VHESHPAPESDPVVVRCSSETTGERLTLRPEGELDIAGTHLMDAELEATLEGCRSVVVDLSGLCFMDSAGVHLLLRWATDVADSGRTFQLVPGSERVQRVFRITGAGAALGLERAAA